MPPWIQRLLNLARGWVIAWISRRGHAALAAIERTVRPDPIAELVRIVGESPADGRRGINQTADRRSRPHRRWSRQSRSRPAPSILRASPSRRFAALTTSSCAPVARLVPAGCRRLPLPQHLSPYSPRPHAPLAAQASPGDERFGRPALSAGWVVSQHALHRCCIFNLAGRLRPTVAGLFSFHSSASQAFGRGASQAPGSVFPPWPSRASPSAVGDPLCVHPRPKPERESRAGLLPFRRGRLCRLSLFLRQAANFRLADSLIA
jgi:hypothetical protein